MATNFDTYCGLCCETCTFREPCGCGGCIATGGKPFHGECEVANCAVSRGKRFCGECENIPCEILTRYSFDEHHGDNGKRIENCQRIKKALVAEGRKGIDPVSHCGHHCDHCFMGQWCGGCRSSYNCCSYAIICDDGLCPNARCAKEKGVYGCWECESLDNCNLGYYSKENEYAAKAAAMFIRKHGTECYSRTLKKAIESGLKYAGDLDCAGSVENALRILEKYL